MGHLEVKKPFLQKKSLEVPGSKNVQDCTALGSSWDTPTNQPKGPKASPEAHGG